MRLAIEKELKQFKAPKKKFICRNCGKTFRDRKSDFCSKWCKKDYWRKEKKRNV